MIDLRPIQDRWPVEIVSAQQIRETGKLHDFPGILADDEAANRAMAQAAEMGWFSHQRREFFSYNYIWDTPSEMEEWIATEWSDFVNLAEEPKRITRSAWASADADARLQVKVKMLITRWKIIKEL